MALLEVDGVSAAYGAFRALFEVSLRIEEGETVAIIGANGAGKSTLLRTVCGLMPATTGAIAFDGRPLAEVPAYRRVELGIVMVPEGRRIFPSLSVAENLMVGGYRRRPGPWSMAAVLELFPNLAGKRDRPGTALSGGEQQALAIGRALMTNPSLLLLDEVSLGLAPIVVKQLYQALPAIVDGGTTLVLIEQDVGQALRACDRVYCLLHGRVVLAGRARELDREELAHAYFGVRA